MSRRKVRRDPFGFALGGVVPFVTFSVSHGEVDASRALYAQPSILLVLGGLVFSARTVFDWARRAFDGAAKAAGFVVLLEGVMVLAAARWLSFVALLFLIVINGIATGCNLSARRVEAK